MNGSLLDICICNFHVFYGPSMACSDFEEESACSFVCLNAVGMMRIDMYIWLHGTFSDCAWGFSLACIAVLGQLIVV